MALMRRKKWYRLDSAARIFPSIVNNRMTTVFRLSATMTEPVSPSSLQHALDQTIVNFPHFQVCLRQGIYWNYFQEIRHLPAISEERFAPCRPMNRRRDRGFQFRVLYFKQRISLECAHVLADGTGALVFLNALLETYVAGVANPTDIHANPTEIHDNPTEIHDNPTEIHDTIDPELWEDAYRRFYRPEIPMPRRSLGAYHLPKRWMPEHSHRILTGTTWLAALQDLHAENPQRAKLLPLRMMVPVNLRALYPSTTMRNFFLTVLPGIDLRLGHFTFREILDTVHHYMQVEVNEKYINQQIRQIVGNSASPVVRFLPRIFKKPFERIIYRHIATARHSGVFTNLGLIRQPESIADQIERFDFIPNPNPVTGCNIGVVTYGDKTTITISSLENYRDPERLFFTRLKKAGLSVSIESNERIS